MGNTKRRIVIAFAFLLSIVACEESADLMGSPSIRQAEQETLDSLGAEIELLIRDKTCLADDECRSIGFGAKPCGGHWTYIVFSTRTVDPVNLETMVTEYNRLNQHLNTMLGTLSDCAFVTAPEIGCVNETCVNVQAP